MQLVDKSSFGQLGLQENEGDCVADVQWML